MTKKIFKICLIVLCGILLFTSLSALIFITAVKNSEGYTPLDVARLNDASCALTVLDDEGNVLQAASFGDDRQPLEALHKYTAQAFVAVEDKRFYSHHGVDVKRIAGALVHNLKRGSFAEGASTISQQLIKNTHLNSGKNLKRKVNEALLALQLEKRYSKDKILEMYLNTIYFGRNAYGIERAANVYFDKSAAQLTLSESAVLAGMIKAPNIYAPDKNADKCRERRNLVLDLMYEQRFITSRQLEQAKAEQINYRPYHAVTEKNYRYMAVMQAAEILGIPYEQLVRSDAVIETYCNGAWQNAVSGAACADCTLDKEGKLCDLSFLVCTNDGRAAACYFRGESALRKKQIGSTAKPFAVYTPAMCERLITQASPVLDAPVDFGGYRPDDMGECCGWTTIKDSVVRSLNIPAVKTLNSLGIDCAMKYLQKFGIEKGQNLSLALGNVEGGMDIVQLAECYAALANGGVRYPVRFVKSISAGGKILYRDKSEGERVFDPKACFLMTDMLRATTKGTAKQFRVPFAAAIKTGTVGTPQGNTQALAAGYTTDLTFVAWYSGDMPNSVNGGSAPCTLSAEIVKKIYGDAAPAPFSPPQGVVRLQVDGKALADQRLQIGKGDYYWFDKNNCPTEKATETTYDYVIKTVPCGDKVRLELPEVAGMTWKIYNSDGEICPFTVGSGTYCAKLWSETECVYTTPFVQVMLPDKKLWDIWVLPGM